MSWLASRAPCAPLRIPLPIDRGVPSVARYLRHRRQTARATFNISTVAAFVVAGAGVRVAKHGNRSISSQCGSADVLEALGVRTHVTPEGRRGRYSRCGNRLSFRPCVSSARCSHVQPVRLELKMRTAFNYLGPLIESGARGDAGDGTWSDEAAEKIAGALARLGLERGYVVHGSDGLGEVTITGPSTVFSIRDGGVERFTVTPEDFGFEPRPIDQIRGGNAEKNRAIAESILAGEPGAPREIVLVNAAVALVAAGKAADFKEGVARAKESIDSGAARSKLAQLRAVAIFDGVGIR